MLSTNKGIKKFTPILWVVLIGMVLGYGSGIIFYKQKGVRDIVVARVDKVPIYFNEYRLKLMDVQFQIEKLKYFAQTKGITPEMFLALTGFGDPSQLAMKEVISDKLLDKISKAFNLYLDPSYFSEKMLRDIPYQLLDQQGFINQKYYREYLNRLNLTVEEYETLKENDIKKTLIRQFIKNSGYAPQQYLRDAFYKSKLKKSFYVLDIPFERFKNEAVNEKVSDEVVKKFFERQKEDYRISEKRSAEYWIISSKMYESKIDISDQIIEAFYEKNKSTQFRIPPEISIRKILIKRPSSELIDESRKAMEKMKNIQQKVEANPEKFAELAKKYSEDTTASKGGFIDYFKRGTYDADIEKEAFKLKEKNQISSVISTKEGLVIIQLVDRKAAKDKPFSSVRDEIVKSLRQKKAVNQVRSDLETILHLVKDQSGAIDTFVKEKGFKTEKTGFLERNEAGYELIATLSRKIFDKKNVSENFGFFEFEGNYILFKEVAREISKIPALEKIRSKVEDDYFIGKADEKAKHFATDLKVSLLSKKKSIEALSKEFKLKLHSTGLIKVSDKIEGIKNSESLVDKAFDLIDSNLVFLEKIGNNYYLVQLEKVEDVSEAMIIKGVKELDAGERESINSFYLEAFIASLVRAAKIEKYEESLQNFNGIGY